MVEIPNIKRNMYIHRWKKTAINWMKRGRKEKRKEKNKWMIKGFMQDVWVLVCMHKIVFSVTQIAFDDHNSKIRYNIGRIKMCTNMCTCGFDSRNKKIEYLLISTSYFFNCIRVHTRKWKSSKHMQSLWIQMKKFDTGSYALYTITYVFTHVCIETYGNKNQMMNQ